MAYEPTIWKDRVVEKPRTFNIVNNPDGTVTLVPAPGVVVEEGTPVNAANLNKLEQGLKTHEADDVQHGKIGTKEVDESGIEDRATLSYSAELEKWVVKRPLDDLTNSPGSPYLISGTMQKGFFGEVPASELITGDALASECGISEGTSQHSTAGWLKFAYRGEILFVAKKPIRNSISWDAINAAKCVYGDSGDKTVVIGGKTYKVRLMRGFARSNDPKTQASSDSGLINHYSEWNILMCQIHEEAINGSWNYPNNIESDIGILEHSLGSGSQGMYSDTDLGIASGNGRRSWCQEMSSSTSYRLARGGGGVSHSSLYISSSTSSSNGWRPVLELVQ